MKNIKNMDKVNQAYYYADKYYSQFKNLLEFEELVSEIYLMLERKEQEGIKTALCAYIKQNIELFKSDLLQQNTQYQLDETQINDVADDTCIEWCFKYDLRNAIKSVFKTITKKECLILSFKYCLDNKTPQTTKQIADRFNLSTASITRIERKALRKLKHISRSKYLSEFL